jgi:hypothetical protein
MWWGSIASDVCSLSTVATAAFAFFDQDGNFLGAWYQFGRPSGIPVVPPTQDQLPRDKG